MEEESKRRFYKGYHRTMVMQQERVSLPIKELLTGVLFGDDPELIQETALSGCNGFIGYQGMLKKDHDAILYSGDSGDNIFPYDKEDVPNCLGVAWSPSWPGWASLASEYVSESYTYKIFQLVNNGNDIYAIAYSNKGGAGYWSYLLKYNGTNAWVAVTDNTIKIDTLIVFNSKVYGGGYSDSKLYEWNGTDAWVEKASGYDIQTLCVFNSKLYGGASTGELLEWNGTNAWSKVANAYTGATVVWSMCVHESELYAGLDGAGNTAYIVKWNGVNAWTLVNTNSYKILTAMISFNSKLYVTNQYQVFDPDVGDWVNKALLLEWDGVNLSQVASYHSPEYAIYALLVYESELYALGTIQGHLFKWDGSSAWTEIISGQAGMGKYGLIQISDIFYSGGFSDGHLYSYTP